MKYYWTSMRKDVKRTVEVCIACQKHGASQKRDPIRPALE